MTYRHECDIIRRFSSSNLGFDGLHEISALRHEFCPTAFAEHLAFRIAGFCDAVGVEHDGFALGEGCLLFDEFILSVIA